MTYRQKHPTLDDGLALWPDDRGGERRHEPHGPGCEYDRDADFWYCVCPKAPADPADAADRLGRRMGV